MVESTALIDVFVGGIAVFHLAKKRNVAADTQKRHQELLEVRAVILAEAVGDAEGGLLLRVLGRIVGAVDAQGGRVEMDVALP